MDFLKKIFGGNTNNISGANQENFVVDETGNAKEASVNNISSPVTSPTPAPVATPVSPNHVESAPATKTAPQSSATEQTPQVDGEYVADTSAFDELMKQAESSVNSRVLDQPVLDPEFQKAKDELENEGGIEIFPTE